MTQRNRLSPAPVARGIVELTHPEVEPVVVVEEPKELQPAPVLATKPEPPAPYVRPSIPLPAKEASRHPRNTTRYGN